MTVSVLKFVTGPIETNTYLVYNEEKRCFIVDPSSGCEKLLKVIRDESLIPESIILTHGHFDHMLGVPEVQKEFPNVLLYVHPSEKQMLQDPEYNGAVLIGSTFTYTGDTHDLVEGEMEIGSFKVQVIAVPGHSPWGIALYLEKYLFCGDILFAGSIGRSDFAGGNQALLVEGIKTKLLVLPDETIVCPGHMGRSTIGREKKSNPFL